MTWKLFKDTTIGFLQDDVNSYSVTRLVFLMVVSCALIFSGYLLYKGSSTDAIALFSTFFGL